MPHFVIDCSEDILHQNSPDEIMEAVYSTADASGLFAPNDIKVRLRPFQHYKLGETKKDFIHIFGNIMEGRSTEQRQIYREKLSNDSIKCSLTFPFYP